MNGTTEIFRMFSVKKKLGKGKFKIWRRLKTGILNKVLNDKDQIGRQQIQFLLQEKFNQNVPF